MGRYGFDSEVVDDDDDDDDAVRIHPSSIIDWN